MVPVPVAVRAVAPVTPAEAAPMLWRVRFRGVPAVRVRAAKAEIAPMSPANTVSTVLLGLECETVRTLVAEELTVDEVRAFCKENLSGYKVPSEVAFLEALPVTSVGKPDRKTLRQMQLDGKLG